VVDEKLSATRNKSCCGVISYETTCCGQVKMKKCSNCRKTIRDGDEKELHTLIFCEDCYIDEVMPKMPKAHYDNDAEFMQRLQDSYSVRKQQFH
jgi:hypothetical protein